MRAPKSESWGSLRKFPSGRCQAQNPGQHGETFTARTDVDESPTFLTKTDDRRRFAAVHTTISLGQREPPAFVAERNRADAESVTITYSVTVTLDATGVMLGNRAEAEAYPPGVPPIVPEPPETVHPVPIPGFELEKASDPVNGTQLQPGEKVTYRLTGTNTGGTTLDPVVITDDLTGVLAHATYNLDAFATIDGTSEAGDLAFDEGAHRLVWEGSLEVGESVTITYSVTVNTNAGGKILENSVTGVAQPPGDHPPIETSEITVKHPVPLPLVSTGAEAQAWLVHVALLITLLGAAVVVMSRRRAVSAG